MLESVPNQAETVNLVSKSCIDLDRSKEVSLFGSMVLRSETSDQSLNSVV
jgi:hypothetical protein